MANPGDLAGERRRRSPSCFIFVALTWTFHELNCKVSAKFTGKWPGMQVMSHVLEFQRNVHGLLAVCGMQTFVWMCWGMIRLFAMCSLTLISLSEYEMIMDDSLLAWLPLLLCLQSSYRLSLRQILQVWICLPDWVTAHLAVVNKYKNNNCIHRRNSRFFTISSLGREPSPTHTLKWPRHNHVQITWNTSSTCHMQHVVLYATWNEGTAQILSLTEFRSFSWALFYWLNH